MFEEIEKNCSRMPFGPGSATKPVTKVCSADRNTALRKFIAYWAVPRLSALLWVLLAFIGSNVTAFSEGEAENRVPAGSCLAASSQSVLITGKKVVSYVPKGSWFQQVPGIAVVNVEPLPSSSTANNPTIKTDPDVINSCASNSLTGQTVCTSNNRQVYVISGTRVNSKSMSDAMGMAFFTGSVPFWCTNCGVVMDSIRNRAVIGISINPMQEGYQVVDLGTSPPRFEQKLLSQAPDREMSGVNGMISEGILFDPIRNLILSPNEHSNFEIVKLKKDDDGENADKNNDDRKDEDKGDDGKTKDKDKQPAFFEQFFAPFSAQFGSAGEDCETGIALATNSTPDFSNPNIDPFTSRVYVADLTRAKATDGSPYGMWSAPSKTQTLSESVLNGNHPGAHGLAVAQGTHTGILAGEWGASNFTAFALPLTTDRGTPEIKDWVTCDIPGFVTGLDPHTVTAYQSPNGDHDGIALLADYPGDMLAWIDLTKMLDQKIVPRTPGKHACAGPLPTTGKDAVLHIIPVG